MKRKTNSSTKKYKTILSQARARILEYDDNYSKLNKMYKQAKKGKKNRSLINAGLGATTGIGPVVMSPDDSKYVSAIGGTTVLTMGTLEATEVIGKSKTDILDRMKLNVELRNQLQVEGDNYARKYALKSARRTKDFESDREKLVLIINNQKLPLLELDASKTTSTNFSNKEIKGTFADYSEE